MNTVLEEESSAADTVPIEARTVPALLRRSAAIAPDKTALVEANGGRTLTYLELEDAAARLATGLRGLGLGKHEFVLVMLDGHIDNAVTWFGANTASVVYVPINTSYRGEMMRHVIENSGARVLIIEGVWYDRLAEIADRLTNLTTVVVRGAAGIGLTSPYTLIEFDALAATEPEEFEHPRPSDISTMLYTSGTEGRAKGVLMPHGQVYQLSFTDSAQRRTPGVYLVTGPFFHVVGLFSGVFQAIRTQGTAVLHGIFSVSRFWHDVRRFQCTTTLLVGPMMNFLLREPPNAEDRDHTLKSVIQMPATGDIDEFSERFGIPVGIGYGSTETGMILASPPGSARPRLCGTPQAPYEVRLVDEFDVEVPRGHSGELVVRPREPWSMNSGYYGMPEATLTAWRNLWFHTGDVFRIEESGQYAFVDRRKDTLRRRGENISSFEVEQHLLELPYVAEVAVVAVPSETAEDEVKAVIVLAEGAVFDPAETLRQLYQRMPYFMVPRYLEVVDSLPRNATLKVLKVQLRASGSANVWDCEAAGIRITRNGLIELS